MGRSILEVWDYRLSTAQPMNYRGASDIPGVPDSTNWIACVYDLGSKNEPLECHDTGVPVVAGDLHDGAGLDACFAFYRSVRDKYSRPEIEELKPEVAVIRAGIAAHQDKLIEIAQMGDK